MRDRNAFFSSFFYFIFLLCFIPFDENVCMYCLVLSLASPSSPKSLRFMDLLLLPTASLNYMIADQSHTHTQREATIEERKPSSIDLVLFCLATTDDRSCRDNSNG